MVQFLSNTVQRICSVAHTRRILVAKPHLSRGRHLTCSVALCLCVWPAAVLGGEGVARPDKVQAGDVTLFSTGEGALVSREVAGRAGWSVEKKGQVLYGDVRAVKSPNVRLLIDAHDGGFRGAVSVPYDSTDESIVGGDNVPGAWKTRSFQLEGKNAWTTVTLEWPDARLARRCNGHDFRFHLPPEVVIGLVRVVELPPVVVLPCPLRVPLTAGKAEGAALDGEMIRLPGRFVQAENSPIVLNAADATGLSMNAGKKIEAENAPAGGAYVHFVEQAEYRFTVRTAGAYRLWERGWFPVKGYNHDEEVDGKQKANVIDSMEGTPLRQWIWVKGGRYELAAGEHSLTLAYHAGARLDRLIFSTSIEQPPAGDGGTPSANVGPTAGTVETADAQPMDVAKWLKLECGALPRGGTVTVELSADGGATWFAAPGDGSLDALPVSGKGRDRLRARLTLRRAPDGSSPVVHALAAVYQPGPDNQIVLGNEEIEVAFGPVGVRALRAKRLGVNLVHGGAEAPLFQLRVKPRGSAAPTWMPVTQAAVIRRELRGATLAQRFRLPIGIDVVCTVTLEGAASRWGLDIDNRSALEVCAAQYPMLRSVRIGASAADDTLLIPTDWRQVIRNPVEAQYNQSAGIGNLAMHWTYLFDADAGLYLGDHNWPVNDVTFLTTRDDPASLNFGLVRDFLVAPGQRRASPDSIVAVQPGGDWHQGADLYRLWASEHIKPPESPAWTRRMDGWCVAPSNDFPTGGYSTLAAAHDRALQLGLGFFLGGNRAQIDGPIEYVGMWPTYCPAYGSLRELQDAHRELRERGGHANWYFNWQLLSPSRVIDRPRIAGVIPRAWVEHPVEWPTREWLRRTAFRWYTWGEPTLGTDQDELVQGIASPAWQKHHHDQTRTWAALYGSDGMYYDQLSVRSGVYCLDPEYNLYRDYGVWARAVADDLGRITKELRAANPHFVTSGELANDLIGQVVDFHMTSGVWNHFEIFHYCLPGQGILDGGWNGGVNPWTGGEERWRYIWMAGACFEGLPDTPYANQLLALRRKVGQLLYPARFLDTVGVKLSQGGRPLPNPPPWEPPEPGKPYAGAEPAVVRGPQAKWFLLSPPSRGAILNVIQDPPKDGTAETLSVSVATADFGPVRAAWALHLDGTAERLDGREASGLYALTLANRHKAATVLLANRVGPQLTLDLPFAAAPGSTMTGTASVTHYGPTRASGTLAWDLPRRWRGNRTRFDLAPGETRQIPVSLSVPSGAAPGRYDLTLLAEADGAKGDLPHWVTVTDPLWVRLVRQPDGSVLATVFNRSDKPCDGTIQWTPPQGVTLDKTGTPFRVEPWAQTELRVKLAGMEPLLAPVHLLAIAKSGTGRRALSAGRSLMLYPPAPNGDFENDSAGDGRPDWWYCWGTGDSRECNGNVLLDEKGPYQGKRCVRLDPHPQAGKEVYLRPIVHAISGGRRYRVRIAMKKTAAGDDAFASVMGRTLSADRAGEWVLLETAIDVPQGTGGVSISLHNRSRNPVWFDALSIELQPKRP